MQKVENLLKKHNVSNLVRDVFLSQNLSFEQIQQILEDTSYKLESEDLNKVIDRILMAKAKNEKVVIVGDYDADGIMATTILVKALKSIKVDVGFYIPNRLKEGYGINKSIVNMANEKGYDLIITVDNGVVAFDALDLAKKYNIDVIVTDHHTINEKKDYNFDYILHPTYLSFGYNDLAGAGNALLIAQRLLSKKEIKEYYVYAMIATIADMVSVFGYNRSIIKNGLYVLNEIGNKHIENLVHYRNGKIDQQVVSFQIVPKLNTAGRLADLVNVNNLVRYFLLDDISEIERVAKTITSVNQERIKMTNNSFKNSNEVIKYGSINIVIDESIHEGLTGLIAGRHMKKIQEPILVLTKNKNLYKGSGRSPQGFNIFSALKPLESLMDSFGGHKQACGLSIKEENLKMFLKKLSTTTEGLIVKEYSEPFVDIDISELNLDVAKQFSKLEPFGVDFAKPLLKVRVKIEEKPKILAKKYLKWNVGKNVEMISFDKNLDIDYYLDKKEISAFVNISINEFRKIETVNLIIQDFI